MNNSQLLENLLLTGTPQDAAEFFADHRNDVDAQRALAIACRFCGLEYVKALAESGAVFKKSGEQPYYWLAVLELYKGQREVYCDDNDDCFEVEIKRTRIDKSVRTFHLLPIEQRAEIVKYLCENRKRVNFNPGELLFYSIMSNNQKITAMLREMGVKFSNERIYGFTKYLGFTMWNIFIGMLMTLDDDVIVDVIRDIIKEIGGKRINCGYKIHEKNFDPDFSPYGRMRNRFFKPEFFSVFLENFKLKGTSKNPI